MKLLLAEGQTTKIWTSHLLQAAASISHIVRWQAFILSVFSIFLTGNVGSACLWYHPTRLPSSDTPYPTLCVSVPGTLTQSQSRDLPSKQWRRHLSNPSVCLLSLGLQEEPGDAARCAPVRDNAFECMCIYTRTHTVCVVDGDGCLLHLSIQREWARVTASQSTCDER